MVCLGFSSALLFDPMVTRGVFGGGGGVSWGHPSTPSSSPFSGIKGDLSDVVLRIGFLLKDLKCLAVAP